MTRVMVFGTFDRLHAGHLHFLRQARDHGDQLIAVVGRDRTVNRLKGRDPVQDENQRRAGLEESGLVDQAVLGSLTDFYERIREFAPDVICLGYDQDSPISQELPKLFPGIQVVRLTSFHPETYKSSKLRNA